MSTVFIMHGTGGNPEENWFPWIKTKLEEHGFRVIIPQFPHSDQPDLSAWMHCMERYEASIDENTIFIGHSLGAALALRFAEQKKEHIRAMILVAPVWSALGNNFDALNRTFIEQPFDWETIKAHCTDFHILHSDNDPYIATELTDTLAAHLGIPVQTVPNGGHLNTAAGYTEFPDLFNLIETTYLKASS